MGRQQDENMSESVVADFVARFRTSDDPGTDPVRGRILLSRKRLVLAADVGRTTVPLSAVFDVSVGVVPAEMGTFFSDTVTVAYAGDDGREFVVVEGDGEDVERFKSVLFKTLLSGTAARVRHPAKVGGRVTDAPVRRTELKLRPQALSFVGTDALEIDLTAVADIERTSREFGGKRREVLAVSHVEGGGRAVTTELAVSSRRKTNVLGRYVRLEYAAFLEEIEELEHTDEELETLVAVYSSSGGVDLGSVLDAEPSQVTMVLNSLREDGLVVDGDGATRLTPRGRVVVTQHLESVNF
jgi:helix-turn-helix protein